MGKTKVGEGITEINCTKIKLEEQSCGSAASTEAGEGGRKGKGRERDIRLAEVRSEGKNSGSDVGTEGGGRGRGKVRKEKLSEKLQVAVLGDSLRRKAGGYVLAEEDTCMFACLRQNSIQDILNEAKGSVAGMESGTLVIQGGGNSLCNLGHEEMAKLQPGVIRTSCFDSIVLKEVEWHRVVSTV